MRIKIGYELIFQLPQPTPMLAMMMVRPERLGDLEQTEALQVTPVVPVWNYTDAQGNRCSRLVAPAGQVRFFYDNICRDTGIQETWGFGAQQHDIQDLPVDVLPFLLASRYCEVDRMLAIAWSLFGTTIKGWTLVQAVCDWVNQHVTFGYQYANPMRTASGVYEERKGVCRDFMHLAVTFLRALNIPARYSTGYLGDIGVPRDPNPMDFSACMEVYLGGKWWVHDPRHNVPRIGRILIGHGRDAVDVAMTTSFGPHTLQSFKVWTDEIK